MSDEEIIENPEEGTAGLTSVCQLVDVTDAVSYINNNTSSDSEEKIVPRNIWFLKPIESRSDKFRKILKAVIEENRDLLRELEKY